MTIVTKNSFALHVVFFITSAAIVFPEIIQAGIIINAGSIASKLNGKCLSVANSSFVDGAFVNQISCNGAQNNQWTLKPLQDSYQIIAKHSGKCLNVSNGSAADGARLSQHKCSGVNSELWSAQLKGDYFRLIAKHSGKCLSLLGATQGKEGAVVQQSCLGSDTEFWNVAALSHTAIIAKHSNQCLNVQGSSTKNGAGITQSACADSLYSHQWTLMPYQDAYRIIANHSGKCITVAGASTANATKVVQWDCIGANNELWYPKLIGSQYQLVAKHSNKCLAINKGSLTNNEIAVQTLCNAVNSQLWQINSLSSTGGKWSDPINLSLVPVAAANLPNGKLLLWSSHDRFTFGGGGKTYTSIFDPKTNRATERLVSNTQHDMFCPGTALLSDGRILVNGGVNSAKTSIYNPIADNWTVGALMNIPRGYQANAVLSNGEVFTLGGSWKGGLGFKDGEVWNPSSGWRRTPNISADTILTDDQEGVYRADNHGWLFGTGDRQVFHAGPSKQMNWFNTIGNGASKTAGKRGNDNDSMNGNAVMYGIGQILKVGGAPDYSEANATTGAYVININNNVSVGKTSPLAYARAFNSSVVLPNGQVLVVGGQARAKIFTDMQPALAAELWDPATGNFTTLASMRIPRTYHSVAMLMPDGRVFVGGGGLCGGCGTNHANAEIFTPPFLLNADGSNALRPVILQAPTSAGYGSSIKVVTNAAIKQFSLIRLSSITHTVNNDQRRIPLNFNMEGNNNYKLSIPVSRGIVIPGYYMLFALNNMGTPSIAKIIKIG